MTYGAFREPGYPAHYPPLKTPVRADVTYLGIIFAFAILGFSFLVVIPGIRGAKKRICFVIRVFLSLFICATIILSLHGQEWEVASIHNVPTYYKAFSHQEIHADISVNIGLKNVNITLKGIPEEQKEGQLKGERIDYNERFNFDGGQGRAGFGRFAGRIQREFREAQWKGLPYPILWIAEYFTLDGEGIRWGRYYRWAGFYTNIVLWFAFPLWLISMILQFLVIRYCAMFLCMTGLSMLSGNIIYAAMKFGVPLAIPFGAGEELTLSFTKGGSFYLCMIGGLVALFSGVLILIADEFSPLKTSEFFNVDPLISYEDTFVPDDTAEQNSDEALYMNGAQAKLRPQYRPSRHPLFHKKNDQRKTRASYAAQEVGEDNHAIELESSTPKQHDIRFRAGSKGVKSTPQARDSVAFDDDDDLHTGVYVNTAAIKLEE